MTKQDERPLPDALPGTSREFQKLLLMLDQNPEKLLAAFPRLPLAEQLRLLLSAPAWLRQELVLTVPDAGTLVGLLPVQEAFLTVKEIGFEDAVPFLMLMTPEQLLHLTDLEIWEKDTFRPSLFLGIVRVLELCGEEKFAEWLETVDPEVLVTGLHEHGRVSRPDIFIDQVEFPPDPDAITYDGYYHYHLKRRELRPLLDPVLRILQARNPDKYGMIMESLDQDMPSEVVEEALRYREIRLSEQGIPDFESACGIYRPLNDEQLASLTAQSLPPRAKALAAASPLYPVRWLPPDSFLRRTLRTLADHPDVDQIRIELAALGNKVLIADGLEVKDPDILRYAFQKVAGYLTIGLEALSGGDVDRARDRILGTWIQVLFQAGYSRVHRLGAAAKRVHDQAGFRWVDRTHCLADSPLEETLRGVLRPRPLYYEGVSGENWLGFREFSSLADVRTVSDRIRGAAALADLFAGLGLSPDQIKEECLRAGLGDRLDTIKWSHVLSTIWVRQSLGGPIVFQPLAPAELGRFGRTLLPPSEPGQGRRLDPEYSRTLFIWLRDRLPEPPDRVRRMVENWARAGAGQLEQEIGGLGEGTEPDPRYIQAVCMHHVQA